MIFLNDSEFIDNKFFELGHLYEYTSRKFRKIKKSSKLQCSELQTNHNRRNTKMTYTRHQ